VPYYGIGQTTPFCVRVLSSDEDIHSLEKSIGKEFFELYARSGITTVKKF